MVAKWISVCRYAKKLRGSAKNNSWWCVAREERKRGNLGVDGEAVDGRWEWRGGG